MATITHKKGLGEFGWPTNFINWFYLALVETGASYLRLEDNAGAGIEVIGANLAVSGLDLIGGTITELRYFGVGDVPLFTITGLELDAPSVGEVSELAGDFEIFTHRGDDLVLGSSVGDRLGGMRGDDTLRGGAGSDFLFGLNGQDRMKGGLGADFFVFVANRGADVIVDFQDMGSGGDDVIALRPGQYRNMAVSQDGDRLVLEFGEAGRLILLGMQAADLGRDDFILGNPWDLLSPVP